MASPANPRRSGASPSPSAAATGEGQVIGKFKRLHHIGKGSFAEVYRGIHIVRPVQHQMEVEPMLTDPGKAPVGRHQVGQHE
jgi:hypothetical protein